MGRVTCPPTHTTAVKRHSEGSISRLFPHYEWSGCRVCSGGSGHSPPATEWRPRYTTLHTPLVPSAPLSLRGPAAQPRGREEGSGGSRGSVSEAAPPLLTARASPAARNGVRNEWSEGAWRV